jgi:membrane glycosyltransferase
MWFSPKIASAIDILLRPKLQHEFGGTARFVANFLIEAVYSVLAVFRLFGSATQFSCLA